MSTSAPTAGTDFYRSLAENMQNGEEVSIRQIYALFPRDNRKTVSWRVHKLVQQGRLQKTGHGYYALQSLARNSAAGYGYMQKETQEIYDIVAGYPFEFYVTGMDALVGELPHVPERHPALLVVEEGGMKDILDALGGRGFIALTEKDRRLLEGSGLKDRAEAIVMKGKDFGLSAENIAHKEQGFVDLYYAVTRMGYGVSIPELSRIYRSMQRNRSLSKENMKRAARARGIGLEISWLAEMDKAPEKTIEFMIHQMRTDRDAQSRQHSPTGDLA